ncbi:MAG: hypothetical protein ACE5EM_08020 [Sphingomonadales bacterium]
MNFKNLAAGIWIVCCLTGCTPLADVKNSAEAVLVERHGLGPCRLSRDVQPDGFIDDVYRFVGTRPDAGGRVLVEARGRTYKGLIRLSSQIREETIDRERNRKTVKRTFHERRFEYRDLEEIYTGILAGDPISYDVTMFYWEETADCPIEAKSCEREPDPRDFRKPVFRGEWKASWRILGEDFLNTSDGDVSVLVLEEAGVGRSWYSPRRKLICSNSDPI